MDSTETSDFAVVTWQGEANCKVCPRRASGLFADLPDDKLDNMVRPVDRFGMNAKTVLYSEGEPAGFVYFVREGLVKLMQKAPAGKPRILRFLMPGGVAGLESLTGDVYKHTAESLLPTKICRIPRETLHDINSRDVHLFGQLMRSWQQGVESADEVISRLSTGTAQGRVARFLLQTLCEPEDDNCVALSRDDMSALLGVTVETASRVVADFKRQGILKERRGWFNFNRAGLEEYAKL